ncbi:MAG TPA: hypothetical protein PLM75_04040 [bacterium]|nr:hypothetical protein [bacterium]HPP87017.1 hypothetical protein [bacterium]
MNKKLIAVILLIIAVGIIYFLYKNGNIISSGKIEYKWQNNKQFEISIDIQKKYIIENLKSSIGYIPQFEDYNDTITKKYLLTINSETTGILTDIETNENENIELINNAIYILRPNLEKIEYFQLPQKLKKGEKWNFDIPFDFYKIGKLTLQADIKKVENSIADIIFSMPEYSCKYAEDNDYIYDILVKCNGIAKFDLNTKFYNDIDFNIFITLTALKNNIKFQMTKIEIPINIKILEKK